MLIFQCSEHAKAKSLQIRLKTVLSLEQSDFERCFPWSRATLNVHRPIPGWFQHRIFGQIIILCRLKGSNMMNKSKQCIFLDSWALASAASASSRSRPPTIGSMEPHGHLVLCEFCSHFCSCVVWRAMIASYSYKRRRFTYSQRQTENGDPR